MSRDVDWQAAWADYRRRRRLPWVTYLGGLGLLAIVFVLLDRMHALGERTVFVLCGAWILGCSITSIRLSLFRCPRCRDLFNTVWRVSDPFRNRCRKCNLRVGEDHPPEL